MIAKRAVVTIALCIAVTAATAGVTHAGTVMIPAAQFAPVTENPTFKIFSAGEGVEWVPGNATVWVTGVELPLRAKLTRMLVYCLDNVEEGAVVQLFRVKGDGSPPSEIEIVVTGGTKENPGTGYVANAGLAIEPRVDTAQNHYFIKVYLPPKPDGVSGILRVTGVEIEYDK